MHYNLYNSALGLAVLAASPVSAFWRLPCKAPIVVERADPIINPGGVSGHTHTIMGGNGFDFTMDYASTQKSTCSSCTVMKDMSNYWVPTLYYKAQNGSFISVSQSGGATVYYLQRPGKGETLKAFPEGFRMVAGNPMTRSFKGDIPAQAISYVCLDYSGKSPETNGFPTTNCPDGLRAQVFFPSCWDGVNLDSADHKSHMAYPTGAYNSGSCPSTHPVHLISLFYEVIWGVGDFKNEWYDGKWPFVWSMGDPTGYGYHGDFVNGWDVAHLQKAVDTCTSNSGRVEDCPVFNLIPDSQAQGCKIAPKINEQVQGVLPALPGCNTVQNGPADAVKATSCTVNSTIGAAASFFKDITGSKGWGYQGCGTDNYYNRLLTGANTATDQMTVENCVDFCSGKGFSIAGLEYGRECYCANSIPSSGAPTPGVVGNCQMPCSGDSTEYCGGPSALGLYKKGVGNAAGFTTSSGSSSAPASSKSPVASSPASASSAASSPSPSPVKSGSSTASSRSSPSSSSGSSGSAPSSKPSSAGSSSLSLATSGVTAATGIKDIDQVQSTSSPASTGTAFSLPTNLPKPAGVEIPSEWAYAGCWTDKVSPRSLKYWAGIGGVAVSSTKCIEWCDNAGYSFAGSENSGQCFCDNTISQTSKADESKCDMPCKLDSGEMCGGPALLSVFTKSNGTAPASKMRRHLHKHRRNHGY